MSRSKELAKNTLLITVGRISTQFVSFLLLPLYTSLLSKGEYGTVDFITTLVQLFVPIMSLMIDQGVFRFLLNCESENEKRKVITNSIIILSLTSIITVLIYGVIRIIRVDDYMLWLLLILIVTAFNNLFLQISRGLKDTGDYALGSFICSTSTIVLNVLCIAYLKMGPIGMLFATFTGNLICSLFLFCKLKIFKYIHRSSYNFGNAKEILEYSLPLVPNQLSIWVMNSSDRLIVTVILGTAANGILAVTHKFPSIFIMLFNIFLLAWHETGTVHFYDDDKDMFFSEMINKIIVAFATLCAGAIVVLPIVFNWFINPAYNEAYYNIPVYLVATLFNVVIGLLGVVYVATKRTGEIAKTTILSAIINIGVHIGLIKTIGLYAASISTFIGYFIAMIYRIRNVKKYLNIKYDFRKIIIISIVLVVSCYTYYINNMNLSLVLMPVFLIIAVLINKTMLNGVISLVEDKIELSKKKNEIGLFVLVLVTGIFGIYVYRKNDQPRLINGDSGLSVIDINATQIIPFRNIGLENFTCTGLTYDIVDDSFWIGDYGAKEPNVIPSPRIIEVDKRLGKIINEIDFYNTLEPSSDLQGVAYDRKSNCLWLALGDSIKAVNKSGEVVTNINMGKYAKYKLNGICYDARDDTLWVLCASKYLIHINKDGTVMKKYHFNYANQDHLCIIDDYLFITVGADYQGSNNFVCKVSTDNGDILKIYRTNGANALEGICYANGKIMIANDGLYHSDVVGESYISIFDDIK